jgi:hypothetical protein
VFATVKLLHSLGEGSVQSNDPPRLLAMVFISIFVVAVDQEDS